MLTRKSISNSTKSRFSIHPAFPIIWGILLILGKSDGVLLVFVAALIHETAHIVAFLAYGERIEKIRLMPFGVSVSLRSAADVTCRKEIFAALAGIAANLAVGVISFLLRKTENILGADFFAACNFALAFINLVPVLPLDGGRALYFFLLKKSTPLAARRVSIIVSFVFLVPLSVCAVVLVVKTGYNFSLLMICAYLFAYIALKREI